MKLHIRGLIWHSGYMRIAVLVKQVPDTSSDRRFEGSRLARGEDDVLNEFDEHAVEAAAQIVSTFGGEVIALTMGPEDASDALVRALALGADSAYLLADPLLENADVTVTARALAALMVLLSAEEPIDAVICGMASSDAMSSMLPAAVAAVMGIPVVSQVRELSVDPDGSHVQALRSVDGIDETLRAPLPAVISVSDQLNEPRFPGFKDLKAARMKPLVRAELDDIAECDETGLLSDLLSGQRSIMPLNVVSMEENARGGSGEIVTDTGDGGVRLAEFIEEKMK